MSGALSTFNPNLFSPLIPTTQPTAAPLPPVSPTVTPSPLASAAQAQAIRTLENIVRSEDTSPPGAPAPPGSALDAGRGLGQIGGMFGNLAGGPLGGIVGRAIGSGIGNAVAASRAAEIADMFGLSGLVGPAAAAGRGIGNAALSGLAGMVGSMTGVPGLGGFAAKAVGSLDLDYNAREDLENAFDSLMQNLEPDERTAAYTRGFQEALAQEMSPYGSDMDFGHRSGLNPSTAASDYYDSGMAGMDASAADFGGGGYGGPGDNASAGYGGSDNWAKGGYIKPKNYANGGVVALEGGGKIAIGPGGGLDDLIPTSINGRRAAALSDGEFVIPADVVSMFGDGSSNAGARRLYDLVRQVRETKTGRSEQAGPLPVGEILKRSLR